MTSASGGLPVPQEPRGSGICIHGNDPDTCDERPDGRCHVPDRALIEQMADEIERLRAALGAVDPVRAELSDTPGVVVTVTVDGVVQFVGSPVGGSDVLEIERPLNAPARLFCNIPDLSVSVLARKAHQ